MLKRFWGWYQKNLKLNTAIAAGLFGLQLIHLYWLTTEVVAEKIFGRSFFPDTSELIDFLIIFVDYTEIPAIITTTILYIHLFRTEKKIKHLLYLFFINIQLVHIFWITDEYVLEHITQHEGISWAPILAWVAIGIDYLELPVIYDTIKTTLKSYLPKKKV